MKPIEPRPERFQGAPDDGPGPVASLVSRLLREWKGRGKPPEPEPGPPEDRTGRGRGAPAPRVRGRDVPPDPDPRGESP
jgi:hypothetical protein